MEMAGLLIIIFAGFAFVMFRNAAAEKKRIADYKVFLRENFGKYPAKEYKNDEYSLMASLYNNIKSVEPVDDITWHDFGMDDIYKKIDQTKSAAGGEYLYWLLRNPNLPRNFKIAFDKDVSFFQKNDEKRTNIQMHLWKLGRINKFSLFDYLNFLETLGARNNIKEWIGLALFIISIVTIFINTPIGIAFFVIMMGYQLVKYLKEKAVVEPFIATFAYIMRLIDAANGIAAEKPEIVNYDKIIDILNQLKVFSKGYSKLVKLNSSAGGPEEVIIEYLKMMTHIDIIQFNNTLNQVQLHKEIIVELSKEIGYCDAAISVASFRESLMYYCVPEFCDNNLVFEIEEGYHPLLSKPVSNTIRQKRGMLITGSNASGKSTFLRMTGINALLAQTIMTCPAKRYAAPEFKIFSSMALQDNLTGGESYYIVEIKALKRILDGIAASDGKPVLCFVDEVLRGTNTVERIAASTQILLQLAKNNVFCFAATHDIELTSLLEDKYDNYHFEEEVCENDVHFSYNLLEGKARTRNAIKLLQIIGFGEDIINHADTQAHKFMSTGEWHVC